MNLYYLPLFVFVDINSDSAIVRLVIWLSGYITQEFAKLIEWPSSWWWAAVIGLEWFLQFDSCCFILILSDFPVSPMYERSVFARKSLHACKSAIIMILYFGGIIWKKRSMHIIKIVTLNLPNLHKIIH